MSDKKPGWKLPSLGAVTSPKLPKVGLPNVGFPKVDLPGIGLPQSVQDVSSRIGEALSGGAGAAMELSRDTLDSGLGLLRTTVGGVPFLGLTTTSNTYDSSRTDEKHYFLIEDPEAEFGFALFVMRCLPDGVPPVNDLTKRRLLHLPNDDALPMLQHIVTQQAREALGEGGGSALASNLDALIDEIDRVDQKVFGGAMALGGLVALANPLAGATIAANALLPSVGLLAAKYGLKAASHTVTNLEMAREIKRVEKDVVRQFRSAETLALVNPVLHHLGERSALDMWMMDAERFQFTAGRTAFGQDDVRRLCSLTLEALSEFGMDAQTLDYAGQVAAIVGGAGPGAPAD